MFVPASFFTKKHQVRRDMKHLTTETCKIYVDYTSPDLMLRIYKALIFRIHSHFHPLWKIISWNYRKITVFCRMRKCNRNIIARSDIIINNTLIIFKLAIIEIMRTSLKQYNLFWGYGNTASLWYPYGRIETFLKSQRMGCKGESNMGSVGSQFSPFVKYSNNVFPNTIKLTITYISMSHPLHCIIKTRRTSTTNTHPPIELSISVAIILPVIRHFLLSRHILVKPFFRGVWRARRVNNKRVHFWEMLWFIGQSRALPSCLSGY